MPHYYTRTGEIAYTQPKKDGSGVRDTTIADARKLLLVPSVNEVIREAAAPALETWKREQMMLAALTLPRLPDEPEVAWLKRVLVDAEETGRKAAERGTQIHDAIERGFSGALLEGDEALHYSGAMKAVEDTFGYQPWVSEKSFACREGYGGRIDLSCDKGVVDFKTTEKPLETLKTWDNHDMQLGAYLQGLRLPWVGAICYVSVTNPGQSVCIPIPDEKLKRGWRMFMALLEYWKQRVQYRSDGED